MPELIKTALYGQPYLKAYYRFEAGALTTDSAGSNTLTAISDPAEGTGVFGGGVDLDSNDAFSVANSPNILPTGDYTVGGWVKRSATGNYAFMLSALATAGNLAGFQLGFTNTNKAYFYSDGTGTDGGIMSTADFTDGNWHLFIATNSTPGTYLYVDGLLVAGKGSCFNTVTDAYYRIGCQNQIGTNIDFLNGSMDDLFLLNGVALNAHQIQSLYQGKTLGEVIPQANCNAIWHMSDLADATSNSRTLQDTGSVTFTAGKFNKCADFGTASTKIFQSQGIPYSSNWSVSAWVKRYSSTSGTTQGIFSVYPPHGIFSVWYTTGSITMGQIGNAENNSAYSATIGTEWCHVVMTHSSGRVGNLYFNGNLIGTFTFTVADGGSTYTDNIVIGQDYHGVRWQGFIDEVSYWNKVLTAKEVRNQYSLGRFGEI